MLDDKIQHAFTVRILLPTSLFVLSFSLIKEAVCLPLPAPLIDLQLYRLHC